MDTLQNFKEQVQETLSQIRGIEEYKEDKLIKYVFDCADYLIGHKLDEMNEGDLITMGGKLAGTYAYLGNMVAKARTERDVYQQQLEEEKAKITVNLYSECESKITLSKARAKIEVSPIEKMLTIKESEKSNIENITGACQTIIMFFQSAMRTKQGERFLSGQMQDNGS
jgi:uncharacterized protein YcfJ